MRDRNIDMAIRIARAVDRAGGRTFYVGGYVRDRLMGRENKDIDIEIHGVTVKALEDILDGLGQRTAMGESFGIMGLRHYDIDIAMPRSEVATGRGHKDFEVFVDPFIGPERAALRRDFTMNALMQDVLTGEVLDFFGGQADMQARRIRHVNDRTFAEDPLRVFRAAQFAARFGFEVAEETVALSKTMAVDALARERVMGELEKALLKAERPSVFFRELRRMAQLGVWFPALLELPEAGWRATLNALDSAAAKRASSRYPLDFMLAALVLALADEDIAKEALERVTNEAHPIRYALNMFAEYRVLLRNIDANADTDEWMALFDESVCPEDLLLLALAVAEGDWAASGERLRALLALYRERMAQPFLMGRDLIEQGMAPGPRMGEALAFAHRLRLAGVSKDEQMRRTLEYIRGRG